MPISDIKDNTNPINPVEAEFNNRIEFLSNVVYKLEETKRQLDTLVNTHEANKINFKEEEVKLFELLKEIETRKSIMVTTTEEMNKLNNQKVKLEQECNYIDIAVAQKREYISDIQKYSDMVKTLQKEMEEFTDQHANNKKNSEEELRSTKQQIKDLHNSITLIVSKL